MRIGRPAGCAAFALLAFSLVTCATIPVNRVEDPRGDLSGNASLRYLDVLAAGIQWSGDFYNFWVWVDGPFPPQESMTSQMRIDFIFFIDADRTLTTGQSDKGNDYNIHLYYDNTGWHPSFYKVSTVSEKDGVSVSMSDFRIEAENASEPYVARLFFPARYLPYESFEWWLSASTLNAPDWKPFTENPFTRRALFMRETKG